MEIIKLQVQLEKFTLLLCHDQEDCQIVIYSENGTLLKSYSFRTSLFLEKNSPLTLYQQLTEGIYHEIQMENSFIQERVVSPFKYKSTLRDKEEYPSSSTLKAEKDMYNVSSPSLLITPKDISIHGNVNGSLRTCPVLLDSALQLQNDTDKTRILLNVNDASYVHHLLDKADNILTKGIIGERNFLKTFAQKSNNILLNGIFGERKTIQILAEDINLFLNDGLFGERQILKVFANEVNSLQRAGYLDNQTYVKSLVNYIQSSIENGYFGENNILSQFLDQAEYHLIQGWVGERKLLEKLMNRANALLTDGLLGEKQVLHVLIKTSDELFKNGWVSELSLLHGLCQQFDTLLSFGCFGDRPILHAIIQQANLLFTEENIGEKQVLQAVVQLANALIEDGWLGEQQPVLQTILSQMDFILSNGWMEKRQIVQAIFQLVDAFIAEGWFGDQYLLQALVQVADTILSEDSTSRCHLLQAIIQVVDAIVLDGWLGEQAHLQAVLQIVNAVLTHGWMKERTILWDLVNKINALLTDCLLGKQPFLQTVVNQMYIPTYNFLTNGEDISINKNLVNSKPYQRWLVRRAMMAKRAKGRRKNCNLLRRKNQRKHHQQKMCSTNRNPFYRWKKDDSSSSNFCKTRLNPHFSCRYGENEVPDFLFKSSNFQSPNNDLCHDHNFRIHQPSDLKSSSKFVNSNNTESIGLKENKSGDTFSINNESLCVIKLDQFTDKFMQPVLYPSIYGHFFNKNPKHKSLNPHKVLVSIYPFYRCFSGDVKLSPFEQKKETNIFGRQNFCNTDYEISKERENSSANCDVESNMLRSSIIDTDENSLNKKIKDDMPSNTRGNFIFRWISKITNFENVEKYSGNDNSSQKRDKRFRCRSLSGMEEYSGNDASNQTRDKRFRCRSLSDRYYHTKSSKLDNPARYKNCTTNDQPNFRSQNPVINNSLKESIYYKLLLSEMQKKSTKVISYSEKRERIQSENSYSPIRFFFRKWIKSENKINDVKYCTNSDTRLPKKNHKPDL